MTVVHPAPPARGGFSVFSVLFGGALVALGVLALAAPLAAGLAATAAIGALVGLGGAIGLTVAVADRDAPGQGWAMLWALAAIALGLMLVFWPASGALTLTLFAGVAFLVRGVFALGLALASRKVYRGSGWVAFGGLMTMILGGLLLANWPFSAVAMLGALVAIDLIAYGVSIILGRT